VAAARSSAVPVNGDVRYWNCPNACPAPLAACIALVPTWLVGKPTRTAGVRKHAEERKRRGSKVLLRKPSQSSPRVVVSCIRCNQMAICPGQTAAIDRSKTTLQGHVDLVTCGFSLVWCNSRDFKYQYVLPGSACPSQVARTGRTAAGSAPEW
jgi:hypothetical protein